MAPGRGTASKIRGESSGLMGGPPAVLEKDAHFEDGVVVAGVEAGGGDLHSAGEDEVWMRRLPIAALVYIEAAGAMKFCILPSWLPAK